MRDVPDLSFETIKRMEDMTWFTHAQIFDDLLIVSQRETSCYILKTSEGLVVIDGIWPDERVLEEIKSAIPDGSRCTSVWLLMIPRLCYTQSIRQTKRFSSSNTV